MAEPEILTKPLAASSPISPEALACPHQYNERLRNEAPVYQCPHSGIFFISDYDTVREIAIDHETFSNKFGQAMRPMQEIDPEIAAIQAQGYKSVDTMLTEDPPVHRRYRGLVNQAFTARRVSTLEPDISRICNELIDKMLAKEEVDFVLEFAEPVPLIVIAEQLGVSLDDYELFKIFGFCKISINTCKPNICYLIHFRQCIHYHFTYRNTINFIFSYAF